VGAVEHRNWPLNGATAIFGVLVAALLFTDEPLTLRKSVSDGLGFVGVVIAIGVATLAAFDLRSMAQPAVLANTLCYALASAWARVHLSGVPPQVAAAIDPACPSG